MISRVKAIREGFHTVTPYLIAEQPDPVIEFMKEAFGAEETFRGTGSAGGTHCEVRIGDSMLMIGGGGTSGTKSQPIGLHLHVADVDDTYSRAIKAGGKSLQAPIDQPYGDREAAVQDGAGNLWFIAKHGSSESAPHGMRTLTPYLLPQRAGELIDFLKAALGAKEEFRKHRLDGTVQHARMQIGDSIVELGEGHGVFRTAPATFFLYVERADHWYERAIKWGAKSMFAPVEQDFGDLMGAVEDPIGDRWYISTHIKDTGA